MNPTTDSAKIGQETVGTTLIWALHALASHQDVQDRLRREVRAIDNGNGNDVKYSDICNLEFLDYFVKEVLRCYPPCKFIFLSDFHILSGIKLILDSISHMLHA